MTRTDEAQRSARVTAVAYFDRTGHCQRCGDPGEYCTCRSECDCATHHPCGSAYRDGALAAFTDAGEQPDLFTGDA